MNGESLVTGHRASVLQDERAGVGGGGCTTMGVCLIPPNCTLKIVKTVNFMSGVFYHNKKKNEKF